jgi:hypothetical protein
MGNLYFENRYGERKLIAAGIEEEQIVPNIHEYVHKLNASYAIYYIRTWENEYNEVTYDVGSHSEFFIFVKESGSENE